MLATVAAFSSVAVLNVCAAVSGVGFSVITTIPNGLVAMYHNKPELYFGDRGAFHQLLSIILKLRILVLLPVSTMPYVVIVNNYS
jgi:hypothetical protein